MKYYQIVCKPGVSTEQNIKLNNEYSAPILGKNPSGLAGDKVYLDYYENLRKRIKRKLSYNYSGYRKDEDVMLNFILNSDGTLIGYDSNSFSSVKGDSLVRVAVLSLRQASPFPPFPKELPYRQLSFSVLISFKK